MLTLQHIYSDRKKIIERLKLKGFDATEVISGILRFDEERKSNQRKLDELLAQANSLAREIGNLYKNKKPEEAGALKAQTTTLKEQARQIEGKMKEAETATYNLLVELPNIPNELVPPGNSDADNEIVKQSGEAPENPGHLVPHWEIAQKADIIDFETGNKVTGAGFPFYKGKGARLQRALISFFLDNATQQGYLEIEPPLLVNKNSGFGTGQLPDKDGQMYFANEDGYYLIPTAEVPLTNMYAGRILTPDELPVKLTGYTPCFRREAGSYGKNVRGLNRLHQFDKVEIVQLQHPDKSYETLDEMVAYVESLVQKLGLTYRIVRLCGKDLSFTSALTYDFEVWSAAQDRWLEVSSVSNFESFQSNRMKLRFKDEKKKNSLLHTLNGSALALPRIVAALLENFQEANEVKIPEALRPYTGFDSIKF